MNVSVFGLGYVGAVSCGCLSRDGFNVVGVDVNPTKVAMINAGKSPIVEEQIGELIENGVKEGRLRATSDAAEGALKADLLIISVGTPSRPNGGTDFTAMERVCTTIGEVIGKRSAVNPKDRPVVMVRSTVMPGTVRNLIVPIIEKASGTKVGQGFGICFNPEFLRESSSVRDYYDPPFSLIGADVRADGERAAEIYRNVEAPVMYSSIETAEMVKYVCNAFHALKVTFANEIGIVAQALGVDSHEVMAIACKDTKLNISPRYLRPGFAFGGSCLPKDVRALVQKARERDLEVPLLAGVLGSNRAQIERAVEMVVRLKKRRIAMLGISFKAGTDDLRESPLVTLVEALIGKGFELKIYDRNISLTRLIGANKDYVEKELPHLASQLTDDLPGVVANAEVVIVGNASPEFKDLPSLCHPGQTVIDLVRVDGLRNHPGIDYRGITW
jgi:GDP-mannose 6-dehydrogenase